jgi:hypothetical protein
MGFVRIEAGLNVLSAWCKATTEIWAKVNGKENYGSSVT